MDYKDIKFVSADQAVSCLRSGDHVHISSVACAPKILIDAMCRFAKENNLHDIHIHHLHTQGEAPYAEPEFGDHFKLGSFFVGKNVRKSTQSGKSDIIPVFLSETQKLYRDNILPVDLALVQVTPPDKFGYVSLGPSVDTALAAIEKARHVVAVVNKTIPFALGDGVIPMSDIDYFVQDDTPLALVEFGSPSDAEREIGRHCAALIDDGATLQMGIGNIPNAVLSQLVNHKNLGIHTEMFADGVLGLVEKGVINGVKKVMDPGKIVSTFVMGSQRLYDFLDYNQMVALRDVRYTNDPFVIAQNPKVTAINSAIEIDITGQVCADSIGPTIFSGVGGQVDFVYGASRSKGGKPIIALPSETNRGESKIVPMLKQGAGVVTTRSHIHWVITEFGAVNLYGKTMQERARLLISIAHPEHREMLEKAAQERYGSNVYPV